MTASRLDELSVNDFDDACDHGDLTTDIRSGAMPDAALFSLNAGEVWTGEINLTVEALEAATPARLARGTEPLQPAIDPHLACQVELHESLTALLELESLVTRCGGFMRMDDQQVLCRARQMLAKHGRR